jgi:hypothetical protein
MGKGRTTTYSFSDLSGAIAHEKLGAYSFNGQGVGNVTVSMATVRTVHDVAADGSIMVSKMAGDNGTISISCQQTSDIHKWLLWAYNDLINQDTSEWAKMAATLRNVSDGTSHIATGISFSKIPDKAYAAQGAQVVWTLMAADIQSVTV